MESEETLQYRMQRFVKLKSVNRVIVADIQTIKTVAKGAKRKKKKMDYKIMYIVCCIIKQNPNQKTNKGKGARKKHNPTFLLLIPFV